MNTFKFLTKCKFNKLIFFFSLHFSLQDYTSKRAKYGETAVKPINDRLSTHAANDILSHRPFYHDCYSNLCNSTKLKRAQSHHENALESTKAAIIAQRLVDTSTQVGNITPLNEKHLRWLGHFIILNCV